MGTDHGRLALQLVLSEKCPFVYATDIKEEPLAKAKKLAARFNVQDKMICKLTNGLQGILPHEVDDAIIAGLGGETIAEIIADTPWLKDKAKRLILVPAGKPELLRDYLYKNGFSIEEEVAAEAKGRIYTAMRAMYTGTPQKFTAKNIYIGKLTEVKTDLARQYIKKVLSIITEERKGREKSLHQEDILPKGAAKKKARSALKREKDRTEAGQLSLEELLLLEKEIESVLKKW